MAYNLISTITVGTSSVSSIDFTAIPQTYTDLLVILSGRSNDGAAIQDGIRMSINGVITNRSFKQLVGTGTASTVSGGTDDYLGNINGGTSTANSFANMYLYIPNYANTTINKTFLQEITPETNAAGINSFITAGLWSSTAAITSLSFYVTGFNIVQYSTVSIYGIK